MNTSLARLTLGVVIAAAASTAAQAGDWNNGAPSLKGSYAQKVAHVPAPVPIPEVEARYYFRIDGGIGLRNGSATESGNQFGTTDSPGTTGPEPFGTDGALFDASGWFSDGRQTTGNFSVGVGRYWSSRLRSDLTMEYRSQESYAANGTYQYDRHQYNPVGTTPETYTYDPITDCCGTPNSRLDGTVEERVKMRSGVFMFNTYYDLLSEGRFRPYIGGGLGFALTEVHRTHVNLETICDPTTPTGCDNPVFHDYHTATDKKVAGRLAAAVSAGITVDVSQHSKLDLGYRYQYIDGSGIAVSSLSGGTTSVDLGAIHEHQLRAGLRWDIQ